MTPPRLDFTALGVKASLNASTTAAGPVTVDVSEPNCVSVTPRSPGKYTVTSTAPGSCTITVRDGTTNQVQVPVQVVALMRGTLANGPFHTCGLTGAGRAYCWGANDRGQLGTATNFQALAPTTSPVAVDGDLVFTQLTAGPFNTHGLTAAGATYCWGDNTAGILGASATPAVNIFTPTLVPSGTAFVSLELGVAHVCGLTAAGAAYCWGGGLTFAGLATGGGHTCGLDGGGAVYCWGANNNGQLGSGTNIGTTTPNPEPAIVSGAPSFISLTADGTQTCGVNASGAAYCWGSNFWGQLGVTLNSGTTTPTPVPQAVGGGLAFAM